MFEFFRKYILQLFVSVIIEDDKVIIRSSTYKKNKTINTYEKTFEDKQKALIYIKNLSKRFEIYYIAVLLNCQEQGLIPTPNEKDINNFDLDHTSLKIINLQNSQLYVNNDEFKQIIKNFDDYSGIDFAYSPISILYYCIQKDFKLNTKTTCYVYKDDFCISILICKNNDILFGDFLKINKNKAELSYEEDLDALKEDEKIDEKTDDEQSQENNLENNEENNEESQDSDEQLQDIDDKTLEEKFNLLEDGDKLDDFNDDMDMCRHIFTKIEEFYNNLNYNSNFIEEMIIFSNTHYEESFISDYIEGEIFLKPQIIQIDTLDLMLELMHKELDNGL